MSPGKCLWLCNQPLQPLQQLHSAGDMLVLSSLAHSCPSTLLFMCLIMCMCCLDELTCCIAPVPCHPLLTVLPYVPARAELFMAGHVSKASDCYAYGILLYEIITGMRAYAGVPIPLLPHEVAMQGLRPKWPDNMPPECNKLRALAEACWQHRPQDRWVVTCFCYGLA